MKATPDRIPPENVESNLADAPCDDDGIRMTEIQIFQRIKNHGTESKKSRMLLVFLALLLAALLVYFFTELRTALSLDLERFQF